LSTKSTCRISRETRLDKEKLQEIWNNHVRDRVGTIQVRNFRTVNAGTMLRAIADENDLSKTTRSAAFSRMRKMKARFDGANPVPGARIPTNAREPAETYVLKAKECRTRCGTN
jgi:hypothetical protein